MRAAALLLIALSACQGGSGSSADMPELVARVDKAKVEAGETITLELRASAPEGWTISPNAPVAEGLEVRSLGVAEPVNKGEGTHFVQRYALSGPPGSYVIEMEATSAIGPGGELRTIEPGPIFIDIGITGPTGGPMAEAEAIPPEEASTWGIFVGAAAALLAISSAIALYLLRRRPVAPPPPEPPHVLALRAWEQARLSQEGDHAVALRLSTILRAYLEAITGFPATARTTREILRELEQRGRLGPALRMNAAHVLDATDRLKFAREGGGEAFFQSMDEDFFAVVEATRPREAAPEQPAPAAGGPRA